MPKVVVGRWRQETAFVPHCIVRISLVFYFSDKNEQNRSTVFEKLSLLIVHFQKRSKNGVQTLFWMIAHLTSNPQVHQSRGGNTCATSPTKATPSSWTTSKKSFWTGELHFKINLIFNFLFLYSLPETLSFLYSS